ncbi:hypothetical protein VNO77_23571 [Canavalia gladiata]|uniref:Uncharacterized protein n=1 Tax=Canavalia gladiata TaxID=3824 RepID=A0AAN9QBY9_CANGL
MHVSRIYHRKRANQQLCYIPSIILLVLIIFLLLERLTDLHINVKFDDVRIQTPNPLSSSFNLRTIFDFYILNGKGFEQSRRQEMAVKSFEQLSLAGMNGQAVMHVIRLEFEGLFGCNLEVYVRQVAATLALSSTLIV